jgi:hypothetical protein
MNEEIGFLTASNMDLQVTLDRVREERNDLRADYAALEEVYAESLQVIKTLNAAVDRLKLHLQQGVEL